MTATHAPADTPDRKATLFCPRCGHESPLPGDWMIDDSGRDVEYVCPDCEGVVVNQSAPSLVHC